MIDDVYLFEASMVKVQLLEASGLNRLAATTIGEMADEIRRLRADLQTAVDLLYAVEQDQVPGEVWQDNCYSFLDALKAREAQ